MPGGMGKLPGGVTGGDLGERLKALDGLSDTQLKRMIESRAGPDAMRMIDAMGGLDAVRAKLRDGSLAEMLRASGR